MTLTKRPDLWEHYSGEFEVEERGQQNTEEDQEYLDLPMDTDKLKNSLENDQLKAIEGPEDKYFLTNGDTVLGECKLEDGQPASVKIYSDRDVLKELAFEAPELIDQGFCDEGEKPPEERSWIYGTKDKADRLSKELEPIPDHLKFLKLLDNQLHYKTTVRYLGKRGKADDYHERKMSENEAEEFLETVEEGVENRDVIIYPINTSFGFSVGFSVDEVDQKPEIKRKGNLLKCKEDQLPNGYRFDRLSEIFKSDENLEMIEELKKLGQLNIHEPGPRSDYTY